MPMNADKYGHGAMTFLCSKPKLALLFGLGGNRVTVRPIHGAEGRKRERQGRGQLQEWRTA